MNNKEEHIDHKFAKVATNGLVSVPSHLKESVFSKLAAEGLSKTTPSTHAVVAKTVSLSTKFVIFSTISIITIGIIIGWQLSELSKKESVPSTPIVEPTNTNEQTKSIPHTITPQPSNTTEEIELTQTHTTIQTTKPSSNSNNITTSENVSETAQPLTPQPDAIENKEPEVITEHVQEAPPALQDEEAKEPEKPKTLLEQLKEKENRFNDNLFKKK